MQDIVYIRLPPGISFVISLKTSEITQMGCFWSSLYSYSQDLTKNQVRNITHHASHITYYIGICKLYKILVINTVVTFNNSSKLILKTFDKYFLMEIITLTIQTPMSGLKFIKPTISRWKRYFLKSLVLLRNPEKVKHLFFFQVWLKKI